MHIVVLTGAGISAESGLQTFRDKGGLWEKYDFRRLATPEAFAAEPRLVHEFYNLRRAQLKEVSPNAAHRALGAAQKRLAGQGGSLTLVTQNVDPLHERGGAEGVLHMHGRLDRIRCVHCGMTADWVGDLFVETPCGACFNKGGLRPDIVWFGEMPFHLDEIEQALVRADLFVSIGTSGSVYPAAGFVSAARSKGVRTVELNLEPSDNADLFDEGHYGPAGEVVPTYLGSL